MRTISKGALARSVATLFAAAAVVAAVRPVAAQTFIGNNRSAVQALVRPMTGLAVDGVPLQRVIHYLRNATNANIVVNWRALDAADVHKSTPITLHLHNVAMGRALAIVLRQASPSAPLEYTVQDNVITVDTRRDADRHMLTRVYDISDLIMTVPNFNSSPSFNLQTATQNSNTQINGGTGGGQNNNNQSLFQNNTGSGSGQGSAIKSPKRRARALVKLIERVVRPSIWTANGGTATIRYFRQQLVVTAPASVQQEIGGVVQPGNGGLFNNLSR